jgi:hypothetical protein
MRIALFLFWVTVLAGSLALPQATTPAPATKKPAPAVKKAPSTKTGATSKTGTAAKTGTPSKTGKAAPKSASKSTKSGKKAPPPVVRQRTQVAPTPERYKDIQAALVEKGYLHGEPTGVWDADSVDALRHFQTDQKLTATGKISAASLIGLGLGPKPQDDTPLLPPPSVPPVEPGAAPPQH